MSALAKVAAAPVKLATRFCVPVTSVRPDPDQPRKTFDADKLEQLAESIRQQGIIADLIVCYQPGVRVSEPDMIEKSWQAIEEGTGRVVASGAEREVKSFAKGKEDPWYKIVDGERRLKAAVLAGLEEVPVAVRQVDEKAKLAVQVIANQQREALSALEEAAAYQKEIDGGRHTAESLYKNLGISRGTLFSRLVLNRLHPPVRAALESGEISVSVAGLVAQVPTLELQGKVLKFLTNKQSYEFPYSFRDAEKLIAEKFMRQLRGAPFKLDEIYAGVIEERTGKGCQLVDVPTCQDCPRRSGNMKEAFPELKNPNVCTDVPCYEAKWLAENDRKLQAAERSGQSTLDREKAKKLFDDYGRDSSLRSSDYVDLSARCEPLGWEHKGHWRATLGKHCPAPILAEAPDGSLHELLKKEDALAALKATGRKIQSTPGRGDETYRREQAKRREKQKRMLRAANHTTATILAKLANGQLNDKLWPLIARAAYDATSIDRHAFVAKRRGLTKVQTDARDKLEGFLEETKDPMECARFTLEVLVCAGYGTWCRDTYHKNFLAAAELAGVDVKKAEEPATPDAKKSPRGGAKPKAKR